MSRRGPGGADLGDLGLATFVGYAIWGDLLQRYPAGVVTLFALLAPCTGVLSSALVFGEVFEPARYGGMALVVPGLAIIIVPEGARLPGFRRATP